jgi:hypothetical protein
MNNCSLPENFWPEAVKHANFIRNILPVESSETQTPYEMEHKEVFDYSWIRTFGCDVWYRAGSQKKFTSYVDEKARPGNLVGFEGKQSFEFEIKRQDGLYVPQLSTSKRLFRQFPVAISVEFKNNMLNTTLILQISTLGLREKRLHLIVPPDANSIEKRNSSSRKLEMQSALPLIRRLYGSQNVWQLLMGLNYLSSITILSTLEKTHLLQHSQRLLTSQPLPSNTSMRCSVIPL